MSEKVYTYDEALVASQEYFNGNDLAAKVFLDKYAMRNRDGEFIEDTPHSMHDRLAHEFAKIDEKYGQDYQERYDLYRQSMDRFARIVPQGSPMAAVGNRYQLMSASNCVVIASPKDSMGGIVDAGKELAELYKRRCGVGLDISTLRPEGASVNNAARTTTGAWSFADYYSYITRKVGQCIAEGERVLTNHGLKAIEEVEPGHDRVWTKKGWVPVKDVVYNGKKKVLKVTTKYGYTIRASRDHVFLSEENGEVVEVKIGDLSVDQPIVLLPGTHARATYRFPELKTAEYIKKAHNNSNRLNEEVSVPHQMRLELAYILGYSYGDGNVERDRFNEPTCLSLACSHDWPVIEQKLAENINNVFSYDCSSTPGDGAVNRLRIHSKLVLGWLEHNGLLKQTSSCITMPEKILTAPPTVQMAFLSGFLDADGHNGKGKKGYVFNTVSESFAQDIQTILMANGVISKIHVEDRSSTGWQALYSVSVTGRHAQKRFIDLFDQSLKVKADPFYARRDNYLTPFKAAALGVTHSKCNYIPDNSQYVSANAYVRLQKEGLKTDKLLIQDSIKKIESGEMCPTYDLVLEHEHLFWCEGFYVHNSGRRGALMITMDVHHPDVLQFTTMKHDKTQVTGANVSLRLSDEFLEAVENDTEYEVRWPVDSDNPKISKMIRARDVWDTIVKSATETAEPGLIMWGNMVKNLPAHCYEEFFTISTNPCSEIALSAYDSCRLISINLTGYVRNAFEEKTEENKGARFDFKSFREDVRLAMQMADNLVDIELGLIDRIKKVCEKGAERDLWNKLYEAGRKGRRTGLGTHGLADTLAQLCVQYDSDTAVAFVDKLYKTLRNEAYAKSVELAQERGAFPVFDWEKEKDCLFIKRLPKSIRKDIAKHGRRNIALLTQAPTGSVSLLSKVGEFDTFNVSSGVEPVFRNSYTRRKKINPGDENARVDYVDVVGDSWQEFKVYHSNVQNFLDKSKETFIGHGFDGDSMPWYFVTSDQIDWEKRVEIQGAEQKYIDHSISSTINLPRGTSPDVVGKLYLESWKRGLKGVTVYVDGSRDGVLVTEEDKELDQDGRPLRITHTEAPKRPKELMAEIHHATVKGVKWTVVVGLLHGEPYELFMGEAEKLGLGKMSEGKILRSKKGHYNLLSLDNTVVLNNILEVAESDEGAWITRMMSMALRHGVPIEYIASQLSKDGSVVDLNNVLARLLKRYVKKRDEKEDESCPQCASHAIVYEEGCKKCSDCGWAGCG